MVTVKQLEQELLREKQLLQEATTYRQQTAELALQVLKTVQNTKPFLSRESAEKFVSRALPSADRDRQLDVAKMLHVVWTQKKNHQNYSVEFQRQLAERKKSRGPISFVLTK